MSKLSTDNSVIEEDASVMHSPLASHFIPSAQSSGSSDSYSMLHDGNWQNLFCYQKQASFVPPSVVCTVIPGKLELLIQFHSISLADNSDMPLVTLLSRGLCSLQQNELVFSVEYNTILRDRFYQLIEEFSSFLGCMYEELSKEMKNSRANNVSFFHSKRVTRFQQQTFCSQYCCFIYTTGATLPDDVKKPEYNQPYSIIIGLDPLEYKFVKQHGISRFLNKRTEITMLYPFPIYNTLAAMNAEVTERQDEEDDWMECNLSQLTSIYQLSDIPDVFVWRDSKGCIILDISKSSHQFLVRSLNTILDEYGQSLCEGSDIVRIPPYFAIQCDVGHPLCTSQLSLSDDSSCQQILSQFGSDMSNSCLGGSFCAFLVNADANSDYSISVGCVEDGFYVQCSAPIWRKHIFRSMYLMIDATFVNQMKETILRIRWISNRYRTCPFPIQIHDHMGQGQSDVLRFEDPLFFKHHVKSKQIVQTVSYALLTSYHVHSQRLSQCAVLELIEIIRACIEEKQVIHTTDRSRLFELILLAHIPQNEVRLKLFPLTSQRISSQHANIIHEVNAYQNDDPIHNLLCRKLKKSGSALSFIAIYQLC